MRVILLQDIPKLGFKGEMKKVADGYALNFLIPRQLAAPVTPQLVQYYQKQRLKAQRAAAQTAENLNRLKNKLDNFILTLEKKTTSKNNLYTQVKAEEITEQLFKQVEIKLKAKQIILPQPIKQIGEYKVKVNLSTDLNANLRIKIVPLGKEK